ncbi:MAG: UDP-galactopyranose mutase, partial [Ignavibacterium sp.]|nr:UDP-galactopyranose mutase [Ignavibacterium sp.]MDW8375130.1 UDP-galactopyranose mutase [Ignavibacteriales bacterium]
MKCDFLIVGAGFAGSVLAERIASQLNKKVVIIEKRNHIGGNAYDEYDEHGILIHKYGPHIFHTNSKEVFDYLSKFTEWIPYEHKVLAKIDNEFYPIPINRITLNKLYNMNLETDEQVKEYFEKVRENRYPILNSEDIIVNQVGYDLFQKFFRYYTKKQWNLEPRELAPTVCGRIPIRTNDDCRYFADKYQFMPKYGYTKMFEKILDHKNIEIVLNTDYKTIISDIEYDKMIYTGPIDYFFDYKYGKLSYRSIRFEFKNFNVRSFQPSSVVNYVEPDVPYTRVTEYKKITSQESESTTVSFEYSIVDGEPYYPILTDSNLELLKKYNNEAMKLNNLILCGRLAEFKYYDMHQVVARALKLF